MNWAGFYVADPSAGQQLILGPFQGKVRDLLWHTMSRLSLTRCKVACQTIKFGKGVCGAAASSRTTQLVPDVEKFPGHIACDGDSKSEIVVPIVVKDKVCVCGCS